MYKISKLLKRQDQKTGWKYVRYFVCLYDIKVEVNGRAAADNVAPKTTLDSLSLFCALASLANIHTYVLYLQHRYEVGVFWGVDGNDAAAVGSAE